QMLGFLANAVKKKEPHAFFDSDAARPNAAIFEDIGDELVRAFVFFPGADVLAEANQFAGALLFELRRNPGELAARRDDRREHPLARAPPRAGVIKQAGTRFQIDGVNAMFNHQPLRLLDAGAPLIVGDRRDLARRRSKLLKLVAGLDDGFGGMRSVNCSLRFKLADSQRASSGDTYRQA